MRGGVAAALLVLTACGQGADEDPFPGFIDAIDTSCDGGLRCSPDLGCNLLENAGCGLEQKCSWVIIDGPNDLGTKACVPDGSVPLGGACEWGPDGEVTGYDNCEGGSICVDGVCEAICALRPDSCPLGNGCAPHGHLFIGETPSLGGCEPLCDPVAQDCATGACYGGFDEPFLCDAVPAEVAAAPDTYSQEDPALTFAAGAARPNGCAPGYAPLLAPTDVEAPPTLCIAYCSPVPTSAESPAGDGGGNAHTCADRGAPTQECRYFWYLEDTARHPDGVGFCWTPETYGVARCSAISETDPSYATSGCTVHP